MKGPQYVTKSNDYSMSHCQTTLDDFTVISKLGKPCPN
jgi:hypothetical protein